MTRIRRAVTGTWEFIAGDDWTAAVGVVLALGLTALISQRSGAWWVTPVAVALLLPISVWREARKHER